MGRRRFFLVSLSDSMRRADVCLISPARHCWHPSRAQSRWCAKAWPYHAYPALLCAILAIICLACSPRAGEAAMQPSRFDRLLRIVVLGLGVLMGFAPLWMTQKPPAAAVDAVRGAGAGPTIAS